MEEQGRIYSVCAVLMQTRMVYSLSPYQDPTELRRFKNDFLVYYQLSNKRQELGTQCEQHHTKIAGSSRFCC